MSFDIIWEGTVEFDGSIRRYSVANRNLDGAPKFFVAYNNGCPVISDEVPEGYKKYMIFHELYEFESLKHGDHKCLRALEAELRNTN